MILGRCVSRAFVLSRLILALCFPPSLISTTLTNVRSINEKSIPHLRNIYRETHLESKDRKIEQSRLLLPPSFSRKIYRAAKSLQSSIRSSVIYHSFKFDVDDYYERRERERRAPLLSAERDDRIATTRWTGRPTFIVRAHAASFAAYWIIPGES